MINVNSQNSIFTTILPTQKKQKSKILKYVYYFIKRIFDITIGLIGTVLLIPITFLVIILKIITRDNGPIFYYQLRVGKDGKVFKIYKFRTMYVDAEEKLKKYFAKNPEEEEEYKKYKKLKNDPRVTKLGRILRDTTLDEWPQFYNVLIGQMSFIGPRPYYPNEKEEIGEIQYKELVKMKPGLTGEWQTSKQKHDIEFKERNMIDLNYVFNANLFRDAKIFVKTIKYGIHNDDKDY